MASAWTALPSQIPSRAVGVESRTLVGASEKEGPQRVGKEDWVQTDQNIPPEPEGDLGGESLLLTPIGPSRLCAPD